MIKEQKLIDAIKKAFDEYKYTLYQCGCGYGQGHQIVYCPKCGGKMNQLKRISATELGKINKSSREWNSYTFIYKVDEYSDGLLNDKYPNSAWGKGFLELISPVLNWL